MRLKKQSASSNNLVRFFKAPFPSHPCKPRKPSQRYAKSPTGQVHAACGVEITLAADKRTNSLNRLMFKSSLPSLMQRTESILHSGLANE
jgi:hypothetical protein